VIVNLLAGSRTQRIAVVACDVYLVLITEERQMANSAWARGLCYSSSLLLLLPLTTISCGGDPAADPPADGITLAKQNCRSCHDPGDGSYSGQTVSVVFGEMIFPANLTPDKETGIGDWTDDQIKAAMRTGVDDQGEKLCAAMPRFDYLTDEHASRIVSFLRALLPVSKQIPSSTCH
jgi:hypothetical protein